MDVLNSSLSGAFHKSQKGDYLLRHVYPLILLSNAPENNCTFILFVLHMWTLWDPISYAQHLYLICTTSWPEDGCKHSRNMSATHELIYSWYFNDFCCGTDVNTILLFKNVIYFSGNLCGLHCGHPCCTAPNVRLISENRIGKNVEGRCRGTI